MTDEILKRIEDKLDTLLRMATVSTAKRETAAATVAGAMSPAPDSDLGGEHGDPLVKWDPKLWKGESHVGKRYSQCSAEYLDAVVALCQWKVKRSAEKGEDTTWPIRDGSRAMGWAVRVRAGWVAPVDGASFGSDAPDPEGDIPF